MTRRRSVQERTAAALLAALVATACGPAPDRADRTSNETAAAQPRLMPLSEAETRRAAIGCLQRPPYPVDGGPTCLRPAGDWTRYSTWGNARGRYRISGNRIILLAPPAVLPRDTSSVSFFRDDRGALFLRHHDADGPDPVFPFRPWSEADYLRSIDPAVAPPG